MCTAISYTGRDHYFGRNLDLEYSFQEQVTITPRNYTFHFRNGTNLTSHYAMIGMATIDNDYPLYYEATNEKGLSIAGLNFPGNAVYYPKSDSKINITPFELIPYLLGSFQTVQEVLCAIDSINLWNEPYSENYPLSPLHWIIADRSNSIVVEPLSDGIHIHQNPVGVLTNNPPFDFHMHHLAQFMALSPNAPENHFSNELSLKPFSLGMGSYGLPGDPSSPSRFIKAAFVMHNSIHENTESASVSQFFHLLSSVAQQKGITHVHDGKYEFTLYSSCCNTIKGIYYYTTYDNQSITAVNMHAENLDTTELISFPLRKGWNVRYENEILH